jgi:DNA (cytosine-5)-methyltransferase 1
MKLNRANDRHLDLEDEIEEYFNELSRTTHNIRFAINRKRRELYTLFSIQKLYTDLEMKLCSSFPVDYNNMNQSVNYVVGMSVPPIMTANIAKRIYNYWLSKTLIV